MKTLELIKRHDGNGLEVPQSRLGWDTISGVLLITSGVFHLLWLAMNGAEWSGPLSPRKPALFGISAGLTVISIVWVVKQLPDWPIDKWISQLLAGSLFAEVGLITLQYWRGEASHFNRSSPLNHVIETSMLVLIVLATLCLIWFTLRSHSSIGGSGVRTLALRAGLWLTLMSCGIGFLISFAAEMNLLHGRSPEVWGRNGVLKYPHGAALHALQTLPLFAVFLELLAAKYARQSLWSLILAHIFFLLHALWQTWQGRGRLEFDEVGGALFVAAVCLFLFSLLTTLGALFARIQAMLAIGEGS